MQVVSDRLSQGRTLVQLSLAPDTDSSRRGRYLLKQPSRMKGRP